MAPATSDLELLRLHRQTAFVFDRRGRMTHESAPDRSRGRRFSFTGSREGNVAVIRNDVTARAARRLERLVSEEPPFFSPHALPRHIEDYLGALRATGSPPDHRLGLLWTFAEPLPLIEEFQLVWSGTSEGKSLLDRFGDAMPASLVDIGFRQSSDLWEPWCVALIGDQIASIAETVRRGPGGAEVGVDTAKDFRGRGLAAATTMGWSSHDDLKGLTLFYSTGRENRSSQRVTDRLGLRFVGSTFAVL
ncbi:MAG: GNAT family N-acetyltransferase [Acidimicrobiales bacterium]